MGLCGCCGNTGLRHIAILKLVGTELLHMGGVLELYPINGKNFFFNFLIQIADSDTLTCCSLKIV